MKVLLIITYFVFNMSFLHAQNSTDGTIIFVQADYCLLCKKMKESIYEQKSDYPELAAYNWMIFNLESDSTVTIDGMHYDFYPTGIGTGEHELTNFLFNNNQVTVPSIFILKDGIITQKNIGYLGKEEFGQWILGSSSNN